MTQETPSAASAFPDLYGCVYMRRATTECGQPGWALFDGDGDLILFSDKKNKIWFHITMNDLMYLWLN